LPRGQRQGGDEQQQPRDQQHAAATLDERVEAEHQSVHGGSLPVGVISL
jgi:hypothetical protein